MSTSEAIRVGAVDDAVSIAQVAKQIDRVISEQPTTVSADTLADVLTNAQHLGRDERFAIAGHIAQYFKAQGLPSAIQSVVSRFVFPAAWAAAEYSITPSTNEHDRSTRHRLVAFAPPELFRSAADCRGARACVRPSSRWA